MLTVSKEKEQEAIELTRKLVQIDSTNPGAYEYEISEVVYRFLKETGAEVRKQEVMDGRCNIIARLPGKVSRPALVYLCHMDTVPVGEGWTTDPLGAEIRDGNMYGRGAEDMKSGFVCAMLAFRDIAEMKAEPERDFYFIATVDEEDLMTGARRLIEDGILTAGDLILDAESTEGTIQPAHKGKTWFSLTFRGHAAHASMPERGNDAVAAMAACICSINRRLAELPSDPMMGRCAATFGTIRGGINMNIVPDYCNVTIDMRLVPPTTNSQSIELVEAAIAEAEDRISGTEGSYEVLSALPAIPIHADSELLKSLITAVEKVCGASPKVTFFSGYTDSGVVAAKTGNPNCLSYGPGSLTRAHKADEYVELSEIIKVYKVLVHLAELILIRPR